MTLQLQVAQIIPCTEAEGPGRRFALWFQGCRLRCPACCNPEMLPFEGAQTLSAEEVVAQMRSALEHDGIEGITLLGGEPTAHAVGAVLLARAARHLGLSVMVFSGHTIQELLRSSDPAVPELIEQTDLLVDGPYLRELPETGRRWIGSSNQQVHFLTDRYRSDDLLAAAQHDRGPADPARADGERLPRAIGPRPVATAAWHARRPGRPVDSRDGRARCLFPLHAPGRPVR